MQHSEHRNTRSCFINREVYHIRKTTHGQATHTIVADAKKWMRPQGMEVFVECALKLCTQPWLLIVVVANGTLYIVHTLWIEYNCVMPPEAYKANLNCLRASSQAIVVSGCASLIRCLTRALCASGMLISSLIRRPCAWAYAVKAFQRLSGILRVTSLMGSAVESSDVTPLAKKK